MFWQRLVRGGTWHRWWLDHGVSSHMRAAIGSLYVYECHWVLSPLHCVYMSLSSPYPNGCARCVERHVERRRGGEEVHGVMVASVPCSDSSAVVLRLPPRRDQACSRARRRRVLTLSSLAWSVLRVRCRRCRVHVHLNARPAAAPHNCVFISCLS